MTDSSTAVSALPPAWIAPRAKAYIGVDGVAYRIRVPVREIVLTRLEGPVDQCRTWTFSNWHDVSFQLVRNARTAPEGGAYDKHRYHAVFADGYKTTSRFDLKREMQWPRLEADIAERLRFIAFESRAAVLFSSAEAHAGAQREARDILATYELGQPPLPAPKDWDVIRDYRTAPEAGPGDFQALLDTVWPEGCATDAGARLAD